MTLHSRPMRTRLVLLANKLAPSLEMAVEHLDAPNALVGVIVLLVVFVVYLFTTVIP